MQVYNDELKHYGVLGMKWGYRKAVDTSSGKRASSKIERAVYSYRDWETDRKSTRLNSSHSAKSRMPSSA